MSDERRDVPDFAKQFTKLGHFGISLRSGLPLVANRVLDN